ncbi:MAG: hypothetical protein HQ564_00545 [Candidatus Saganbacteria bacterium]|nr:hypothetical protein [Candidatus Saganbacteria bacterium]
MFSTRASTGTYKIDRGYTLSQSFIDKSGIGDTRKNIANRIRQDGQVSAFTIGCGEANYEAAIARDNVVIHSNDKDIGQVLPENRVIIDNLIDGPFEEIDITERYDLILSIYGTFHIDKARSFDIAKKIWDLLALNGEAFFMLNPSTGIPSLDMLAQGNVYSDIMKRELDQRGIVVRAHTPPEIFLSAEGDPFVGVYFAKLKDVALSEKLFSQISSEAGKEGKEWLESFSNGQRRPQAMPLFRMTRSAPWQNQPNLTLELVLNKALQMYKEEYERVKPVIVRVDGPCSESRFQEIILSQAIVKDKIHQIVDIMFSCGLPLDEAVELENFKHCLLYAFGVLRR